MTKGEHGGAASEHEKAEEEHEKASRKHERAEEEHVDETGVSGIVSVLRRVYYFFELARD